jgi:hypothetical protein
LIVIKNKHEWIWFQQLSSAPLNERKIKLKWLIRGDQLPSLMTELCETYDVIPSSTSVFFFPKIIILKKLKSKKFGEFFFPQN